MSAREGELRRLTMMFCDLVGSTELSGRHEPEPYRELMRAYRATCHEVIEARFEGHIVHIKGDGLLSVFGYPVAHENDAERAVRAGVALVRAVRELGLDVRVGIHHGPVYLDFDDDDVYGLAANVGARLHGLAEPGEVVVSDEVRALVGEQFEIEAGTAQLVKGVAEPLTPFRIVRERQAPRAWSTPLVEREPELQQLREAWTRTTERSVGKLVRGEAGLGKSRLVAALVDEADANVIRLHGSPFHEHAGFHPVRVLIEARCGIDADATPRQRMQRLYLESEWATLLAPVLDLDPSAGYEPAAAEGRRLEEQIALAVLDYMLQLVGNLPTILVAEDLHWFDDSTRMLLSVLLRTGPGNLLVLGTSRNREPGPWELVELEPLSHDGRLALIDALDGSLSPGQRAALATRSDGIPLFVEELVRAGPVVPPAGAPVPGSVPEALYEPLVARLYATPDALGLAATAAAAGPDVDRRLLAAAMAIPAADFDATLQTLVDARVLEPVGARYQFRHELLREVAYELQPPSWRRAVHSRFCDLLARDAPGDWYVLASHFERAERFIEAAEAYEHTAEWARRRGALDEARAHLEHGLELVLGLVASEARDHREVQLRLRRGFLAMSADGAGSLEAAEDFGRCLALASADPRGDDMFSTLISVWAYHLARAELDRTREISHTLRRGLDGKRELMWPQNRAGFGMLDWFAGEFTAAEQTLSAATAELERLGGEDGVAAVWFVPNDPTAAMYVHLALARFTAGLPWDESLARAREHAAGLDFPQGAWSDAYAIWLGSWIWLEEGQLTLAESELDALRAACEEHGFESWDLIAATQTATLEAISALRSGGAGAEDLLGHAEALGMLVDLWQAGELRVFLPFYLTTVGALLAAAGETGGACERYAQSLALGAETGMRFYDAETQRLLAQVSEDREPRLRAALELARAQGARPFERRIEHDLRALAA